MWTTREGGAERQENFGAIDMVHRNLMETMGFSMDWDVEMVVKGQ